MKISMPLDYSGGFVESVAKVVELEKAGLDLIWVAEAYGFDAPSLMGYIAAKTSTVEIGAGILPIYTRTPSLIAQTAAGVDALSGGRCVLGLGASGPQVIEGWHGVPYDAPLGRTREIIEICRKIWAREDRLEHDGKYYQMPLGEGQGTGLGKPLKIIAHPVRSAIPTWVASLGPKNVEMTATVADGWLPMFFLPERARDVWGDALDAYYDEHETIGNGADARSSRMLVIDEGHTVWEAQQILADPAGDHDWRIWATIDLAASAEAGVAVVQVTRVGRMSLV